ncbi:hypothetical protein [Chroococcidiopsis sp. CCMEE 29]|uniref:hypothetical protein n=1 Tax=Chroococcidiopsis sp. CCMEE 29 TaxID=155894 RepID=UPI0020207572|nr:hypothetical protein [Chroococcidiopsis sp. CCMEE 29]
MLQPRHRRGVNASGYKHLRKNDSEHEGTPQTDSLRDSSVNHALIAIAQEVAELLKQAYPVQVGQTDRVELIDGKRSTQ